MGTKLKWVSGVENVELIRLLVRKSDFMQKDAREESEGQKNRWRQDLFAAMVMAILYGNLADSFFYSITRRCCDGKTNK